MSLGHIYTDKQPVALSCLACEFVKLRGACNFASLSVMHQVFFYLYVFSLFYFLYYPSLFFMTAENLLCNSHLSIRFIMQCFSKMCHPCLSFLHILTNKLFCKEQSNYKNFILAKSLILQVVTSTLIFKSEAFL